MLIRTIEPKSLYNCVRQKSGVIFCHGFFNKKSGATTEFRFLPRKKIRGKKKSMSDLVNVFENQKIFLKKGGLLTWKVLLSKRMYTNLTADRSKKKYHPISTNPKIGVRGGEAIAHPR